MTGQRVRLSPAGLEHYPDRAGQIGEVIAVWDRMTGIRWQDGVETFVRSEWVENA